MYLVSKVCVDEFLVDLTVYMCKFINTPNQLIIPLLFFNSMHMVVRACNAETNWINLFNIR